MLAQGGVWRKIGYSPSGSVTPSGGKAPMIRRARLAGGTGALVVLAVSVTALYRPPASAPLHGVVDLTIGGADETRENYMFDDVRGLALDRRGRILVADSHDNNIRVFSPAGVYAFTIGRPGQGPGGLREPCCIAVAAGDTLWVEEFANRRKELNPGALPAPSTIVVANRPRVEVASDAESRAIVSSSTR